jgi:hypothetical protein
VVYGDLSEKLKKSHGDESFEIVQYVDIGVWCSFCTTTLWSFAQTLLLCLLHAMYARDMLFMLYIRKIKNFLKDLAALIRLNSDFKHILS